MAERLTTRARLFALAGILLIATISIAHWVRQLPDNWPYISGWEYEWIGDAIGRGEGFSFQGEHRWLFETADPADHTDPAKFYPTAWEEPVYPLLLGVCFRLFGERGRVVMLLIQVLSFLATLALVYQLGKRIATPAVGVTAAVILAFVPRSLGNIAYNLSNTSLAGLVVCACVLLTLSCLQHVAVRRALALGAVIGMSALTHAATMIFAPLAALVLLLYGRPRSLPIRRSALAVVLATAIVLSPWAIRNYVTFGHFVPVRTGLGFIADVTNPSLAETFAPDASADAKVPIPWRASGPVRAWRNLVHDLGKQQQLYDYAMAHAKAIDPSYLAENEAERDHYHLRRALAFMLNAPATAITLMVIKAAEFYGFPLRSRLPLSRAGIVTLLALVGLLLEFRSRDAQILTLFILAYSAPYIVTGTFYYRYRYPIDPLTAVLAGIGIMGLLQWAAGRRHFPWLRAASARPVGNDG